MCSGRSGCRTAPGSVVLKTALAVVGDVVILWAFRSMIIIMGGPVVKNRRLRIRLRRIRNIWNQSGGNVSIFASDFHVQKIRRRTVCYGSGDRLESRIFYFDVSLGRTGRRDTVGSGNFAQTHSSTCRERRIETRKRYRRIGKMWSQTSGCVGIFARDLHVRKNIIDIVCCGSGAGGGYQGPPCVLLGPFGSPFCGSF